MSELGRRDMLWGRGAEENVMVGGWEGCGAVVVASWSSQLSPQHC